MRLSWITTAALTLGVSSFIPTLAYADERYDDRGRQPQYVEVRNDRGGHDDRHVEVRRTEVCHVEPIVRNVHVDRDVHFDRYRQFDRDSRIDIRFDAEYREACPPNFDTNISLNDVPEAVMCAERAQVGRGRIEAIQYVRRDGKLFYRFRIDGRTDMNYRFAPNGDLLSVEAAG